MLAGDEVAPDAGDVPVSATMTTLAQAPPRTLASAILLIFPILFSSCS